MTDYVTKMLPPKLEMQIIHSLPLSSRRCLDMHGALEWRYGLILESTSFRMDAVVLQALKIGLVRQAANLYV